MICKQLVDCSISEVFRDASGNITISEEEAASTVLVCFNDNKIVVIFQVFDEVPLVR